MRVQLTALLLCAGAARADDVVQARVDVYADPWVTVVIPATGATVEREKATVAGSVTLDFVSGATPALEADLVSSATWFRDTRVAGELSATWHPETTWSAGAHVGASTENDFAATSGGVSGSIDLADRRVTLAGSLTAGREVAWRASGGPKESSATGQLDVRATGVVDRNTTVTVFTTGRAERCGPTLGCGASPYRYVPYVDDVGPLFALPEQHPTDRWRLSGAVRLSRAFGDWTALHATARLYGDSWGVVGHTGQIAFARQLLRERLLVRAEARVGWQGPASFWRDTYPVPADALAYTPLRTADGELSGFRELVLEARASWSFYDVGGLSRLTVDARAAPMWFWYPRYAERPRRNALLVGGGLGATF